MADTMTAVRLHKAGEPLKIDTVPIPELGPRDVLVDIKVTSICGTDVSLREGAFPIPSFPVTMGHEASGVVARIGSGVTRVKVGDRVSICCMGACYDCWACNMGREDKCVHGVKFCGCDFDGSFATYMKVAERSVVKLPDKVSFEAGAVLTDALATPYNGLSTAGLKPGEYVALYGAGGLGLCAVQLSRIFGASRIIAIDVIDEKLAIAKELGADYVINSTKENPVEKVKALTGGEGVHVAVDMTGANDAQRQCIESVRNLGRVVFIGLHNMSLTFNPFLEISLKALKFYGIYGFSATMYEPLMDLIEAGRLNLDRIITHRLSFPNDVNKGLDILETKQGNPMRVIISQE